MSDLVVTQTSPLKYIIRQAPLTASPRQTPCNIFPDTRVLGHIIPLISLLKHHLAMQRHRSAQRRNERRAARWKNSRAWCRGRLGCQNPPALLKSQPEFCSCQKKRDVLLTDEMQCDFSHIREGSWRVGGVSSSLHPKQEVVVSYLRLTSGKFTMLWASRGPLGHAFGREIKLFNFSAS